MQYKLEFPSSDGENFDEKKIIDLIEQINISLDKYRHKIFPHQIKELKDKILILEKIKNGESDLDFNTLKEEVLVKLEEVKKEYKKQIELDELYKDDHLDPYRSYK